MDQEGRENGEPKRRVKKEEKNERKRKCISSACVPCRKRKSKCDGRMPQCSACAAVYNTECIYDPGSDHRRKGVYKKDVDAMKTRSSTLQTLVQAILNYPEDEVAGLVKQIRSCENLDAVAESILAKEHGLEEEEDGERGDEKPRTDNGATPADSSPLESQLAGKMGGLRLEDGSKRYIGGTSNLIYLEAAIDNAEASALPSEDLYQQEREPVTSWTSVTNNPELVMHLMNMYFTWHYSFFTTLSKSLFYRDFLLGKPPANSRRHSEYCSPLLVNAMLALGCHFTSWPEARAVPDDSSTAGDHFFKEAKRLILEGDLHEQPRLTTVQALALMSVREAGCAREAKGWVYSGMSFRMACDLGLNLNAGGLGKGSALEETEEDARRITFWGCFLFDKCWSNYLGRLPQLPTSIITVPKFEVFPVEDAEIWCPYTDSGFNQAHAQPARTRALARQISLLCEISNDLMNYFYNPIDMDKPRGKQAEIKKLSEIHQRLENWRRELPKEFEPKEGGHPSMLVMHMFFQILYIHLFRPFLKYNQSTSPLPASVSPRKLCTQAAAMISKLLRLYKRSHGLRQICNIAVYIAHSACTIHLLNLPEKNAKRDITHGVKHLEEIAEGWLCARRTLCILSLLARKWEVELPEEAAAVLARADAKFGPYMGESNTPKGAARQSEQTQHLARTVRSPLQSYDTPQHDGTPVYIPAGMPPATAPGLTRSVSSRLSSGAPSSPQSIADVRYAPYKNRDQPLAEAASVLGPIPTSVPTSEDSPSQLFGGNSEALMRESQDWWLRDQSQLALGFDNWDLTEADVAWLNNATAMGPATNGGVPYPMTNNMNVMTGPTGYEAVNTYNEAEWYQ